MDVGSSTCRRPTMAYVGTTVMMREDRHALRAPPSGVLRSGVALQRPAGERNLWYTYRNTLFSVNCYAIHRCLAEELAMTTHRANHRVIAVANLKGGVGKTTTVLNLAGFAGQMGKRVLAVDT